MNDDRDNLSSLCAIAEPGEPGLQTVLDCLLAYVWILDPDGKVIDINKPALSTGSLSKARVIGSHFRDCALWNYDSATQTSIERACAQAGAGAVVRCAAQAYLGRADTAWLDLKLAPVLDGAGRVGSIVVSGVDITTEKQAMDALRESRTELELALIAGRGGVWDWDIVKDVTRVSPSYRELYGHALNDEVTFENWISTIAPEDRDRVAAYAEEFFRSGQHWNTEYRVQHPVLGERWLAAVGILRRDDSGRAVRFLGINVDITDRKRAEQALLENDRRKDEFLAVLGHELRNPLAPLRTGIELLQMGMPSDEVDEVHAMLARQVDHLARLVDDLLDLSRISRGTVRLQLDTVDLNDIIDIAIELARPRIEERRHELVDERDRAPVMLHADAQRVAQIVSNLLDNAAKYTKPGGRIGLWVEKEPGAVTVHIEDSGLGIPPDQLESVFEMFSQVREHHLATGGGALGIGLALSRQLAALHQGTIEAKSAGLDRGSEFLLRLPVTPAAQPFGVAPAREGTAHHVRRRVLVVDDNRDAASMVGTLLEVAGHRVRVALDAYEALEAVSTFEPEVVLLDIGMPGMDGYEAARRIRALPRGEDILLVALTGWGKDEDRQRARDAGFDEHLAKPAGAERLLELIAGPPLASR